MHRSAGNSACRSYPTGCRGNYYDRRRALPAGLRRVQPRQGLSGGFRREDVGAWVESWLRTLQSAPDLPWLHAELRRSELADPRKTQHGFLFRELVNSLLDRLGSLSTPLRRAPPAPEETPYILRLSPTTVLDVWSKSSREPQRKMRSDLASREHHRVGKQAGGLLVSDVHELQPSFRDRDLILEISALSIAKRLHQRSLRSPRSGLGIQAPRLRLVLEIATEFEDADSAVADIVQPQAELATIVGSFVELGRRDNGLIWASLSHAQKIMSSCRFIYDR